MRYDQMPDCWMILGTVQNKEGVSFETPMFDHGWETRKGAEEMREEMVRAGHFTYGELTIKRYAVVPKEL